MSATTETTANGMFETLTGFDEIAIKREFKADIYTLAAEDKAAFMRALIFIDQRRAGLKDAAAYRAAMELPQAASVDYFAAEPTPEPTEDGDDLGEA